MWDIDDTPENIWRSDKENDMGYICKCGHIPSFRELKRGTCPNCREQRKRENPDNSKVTDI